MTDPLPKTCSGDWGLQLRFPPFNPQFLVQGALVICIRMLAVRPTWSFVR